MSSADGRPTAGLRAVARAVAWRSIHNFLHDPALFSPALIFPLFFFASFAGGLSAVGNVPGFDFPTGYTAFQYVFVLLQSAVFGGVFTGFGVARDFETGFGRRYLLAATDRRGIIVGYGIAALFRSLLTCTFLTVVALLGGMNIDGSGVDLFGLFVLAILLNITATLWASGVALRVRSIQGGPLMQLPIFMIFFLAPVYVPLSLLSGWIHAVASVNPMTALLEAARGFISGDPTMIGVAFGLAAVLLLIFTIWSRTGLRQAEAAG